jgi:hypothetical protein
MAIKLSIYRLYEALRSRWVFAIVWLPVGAFGVYLKSQVLDERSYRVLAGAFGRRTLFPYSDGFSALERLSLYVPDIVLGVVVVPLVLVTVLTVLPRRLCAALVAALSVALSLGLFFELQSLKSIGHFVPWNLISDALHWGYYHPEYIAHYFSASSGLKFAILVGAILFSAALAHRMGGQHIASTTLAPLLGAIVTTSMVGALALSAIALPYRIAGTWYSHAAILEALTATLIVEAPYEIGAKTNSIDTLKETYASLAGWRSGPKESLYWKRADGYDVVVFILETAPARYLSFSSLDDLPSLRRLAATSWIASAHHTTFPYTAKATFSILTSMYPPDIGAAFGGVKRSVPGLVKSLNAEGYETRYYVPHAFENSNEDAMYSAMEFTNIFVSDSTKRGMPFGQQYYEDIIRLDLDAFGALQRDVKDLVRQDRRYLAVFSPQIGHAPWPDISNGGAETSLARRARSLLVLQDKWLGQLVELLANEGRLDRTLIVVTGDHGVRTAIEDPTFEPHGVLQDYSFHVPFLLFAPRILHATQYLTYLTSHIDISPTILELLGVERGRDFEQGMPVWDSRGADRTVFLWAGDYFGAVGYCRTEGCTVWNQPTNVVYAGRELDDKLMREVSRDSGVHGSSVALLNAMAALNREWWSAALVASDGK